MKISPPPFDANAELLLPTFATKKEPLRAEKTAAPVVPVTTAAAVATPTTMSSTFDDDDKEKLEEENEKEVENEFDMWCTEASRWLLDKSIHDHSPPPTPSSRVMLKTFNSILLDDQLEGHSSNLAAVAIVGKTESFCDDDGDVTQSHSSYSSSSSDLDNGPRRNNNNNTAVILMDFVRDRMITFTKNCDYAQVMFEERRRASVDEAKRQRRSVDDFVKSRLETFAKNIEFAQEATKSVMEASASTSDDGRPSLQNAGRSNSLRDFVEARVDTFNKNIGFAQETTKNVIQASSGTSDDGRPSLRNAGRSNSLKEFLEARVDTFAKNVDFANETVTAVVDQGRRRTDSLEVEEESKDRRRRTSSSLGDFVEARFNTLTKNLDYTQDEVTVIIESNWSKLNTPERRRSMIKFVDDRSGTFAKNVAYVQINAVGMIAKRIESTLQDVNAVTTKRRIHDESRSRTNYEPIEGTKMTTLSSSVSMTEPRANASSYRANPSDLPSSSPEKGEELQYATRRRGKGTTRSEPVLAVKIHDRKRESKRSSGSAAFVQDQQASVENESEKAGAATGGGGGGGEQEQEPEEMQNQRRNSLPAFVGTRMGTFERNMKAISSVIFLK